MRKASQQSLRRFVAPSFACALAYCIYLLAVSVFPLQHFSMNSILLLPPPPFNIQHIGSAFDGLRFANAASVTRVCSAPGAVPLVSIYEVVAGDGGYVSDGCSLDNGVHVTIGAPRGVVVEGAVAGFAVVDSTVGSYSQLSFRAADVPLISPAVITVTGTVFSPGATLYVSGVFPTGSAITITFNNFSDHGVDTVDGAGYIITSIDPTVCTIFCILIAHLPSATAGLVIGRGVAYTVANNTLHSHMTAPPSPPTTCTVNTVFVLVDASFGETGVR